MAIEALRTRSPFRFERLQDSILAMIGRPSTSCFPTHRITTALCTAARWGRGGGKQATRVAALHYYRDSCPAIAQPLNRNLSKIDLLLTLNQIDNHNWRAVPGLVQACSTDCGRSKRCRLRQPSISIAAVAIGPFGSSEAVDLHRLNPAPAGFFYIRAQTARQGLPTTAPACACRPGPASCPRNSRPWGASPLHRRVTAFASQWH
jgi:hypothetical protein